MLPKGNLTLDNVILNGSKVQQAFATKEKEMSSAYNLKVKNSEISEFDCVLKAYKDSFADTISFDHTVIKNCKRGLSLAAESDNLCEYNAEFVTITNSKFDAIQNGTNVKAKNDVLIASGNIHKLKFQTV